MSGVGRLLVVVTVELVEVAGGVVGTRWTFPGGIEGFVAWFLSGLST